MNRMVKLLIGLGLGVAVLGGGWLYYSNTSTPPSLSEEEEFPQEETEEFTSRMRAETIARVGQPIEGFEPLMFMQAFPGLIASDFANVDALIGLYRHEGGEVIYDLNGEIEAHSAARAISDEGMKQLLANISSRITFMAGEDMLDQLFLAISPEASAGARVELKGTLTCLPHKGDGPHTLECAYGLAADDGDHYGLRNLFTEPGPWEFDIGDRVRVRGPLTEPPANEKYDIVSYIEVELVEGL